MTAPRTFTASARKLGLVSSVGILALMAAYAATLATGLLSLRSPDQPIEGPLFAALEILILLTMPFMVALAVAIHSWAPTESKAYSLLALVFMCMLAGLTCSVHFVILTAGSHRAFSEIPWMPLLLSFKWPSVAYALDILAWDVFFALFALFAAPAFRGGPLGTTVRVLLVASGILALAGLSGVIAGDMQLRNIGIVGYVGVFPIASMFLAILFYRAVPD